MQLPHFGSGSHAYYARCSDTLRHAADDESLCRYTLNTRRYRLRDFEQWALEVHLPKPHGGLMCPRGFQWHALISAGEWTDPALYCCRWKTDGVCGMSHQGSTEFISSLTCQLVAAICSKLHTTVLALKALQWWLFRRAVSMLATDTVMIVFVDSLESQRSPI